VTVSRLSESTYNQMSASSPLWNELFKKGFKFRVVLDRDKNKKVAAVKENGGFSV